jgi:hypothetical protein
MDASLRNILLGTLVLTIGMYILKVSYDSFSNPPPVSDESRANMVSAHKQAPAIDQKVVDSIKTSIKNFINERPDVISTVKLVLQEPLIKKTLGDVLYSVRAK